MIYSYDDFSCLFSVRSVSYIERVTKKIISENVFVLRETSPLRDISKFNIRFEVGYFFRSDYDVILFAFAFRYMRVYEHTNCLIAPEVLSAVIQSFL